VASGAGALPNVLGILRRVQYAKDFYAELIDGVKNQIRKRMKDCPSNRRFDFPKDKWMGANALQCDVNLTNKCLAESAVCSFVPIVCIENVEFGRWAYIQSARHRLARMRALTSDHGEVLCGCLRWSSRRLRSSANVSSVVSIWSGTSAMLSQIWATSRILSGTESTNVSAAEIFIGET